MFPFRDTPSRQVISPITIQKMRMRKYSDDQPRDDHGRWTDGGGSDALSADSIDSLNERVLQDPQYKAAMAKNQARGDARKDPGVLDEHGNYTIEANVKNINIAQSMLNEKARVHFGEQPEAVIMLGKPGSGKTTLKEQIGLGDNYVNVDADAIMAKLPGFEPDLAGAYHNRAADIAEQHLIPLAVGQNMNMVLDMTGRSSSKMLDMADSLKSLGYRISVYHANISDLEAGKRAYSRWKKGGRLVPVDYVTRSFGTRPKTSYELLKQYYATTAREYDTSTRKRLAKGAHPIRKYRGRLGGRRIEFIEKYCARAALEKYSDDEPRDDHGRWTDGGGGSESDSKVIFEVAPNPDDIVATARWNKLSPEEKFQRSKEVAEAYVPQILQQQGIVPGQVKVQYGSYQDDTNPSFSLELPENVNPQDIVEATKALGYNLSQKSMIAIANDPFPGSSPVDAIHIQKTEEFTLDSANSVYNDLRGIESDGLKAVGGATTVGNTMTVLNFPDEGTGKQVMSTEDLAKAIQAKLPDGYTIYTNQVNSWFATQENDYGNYQNNQAATGSNLSGGSISETSGDFRNTITAAVTKAVQWILESQFGKAYLQKVLKRSSTEEPKPLRMEDFPLSPQHVFEDIEPFLRKKKTGLWSTRMIMKGSRANSRFALNVNKVKGHKVAQSFADLHKKYEPKVAAAYSKAAASIKKQINLKDLAAAVNSHHPKKVVDLAVGDKFKVALNKEFKTHLFEAYHAGAMIGSQQLLGAHTNKRIKKFLEKGGPGSGRYPAGSGAGRDLFNDILSRQRSVEGLRPALRHYRTDEVFPSHGHETHWDIRDRVLPSLPGTDESDLEEGFITRGGSFITRDTAENGFPQRRTAKALSGSLNLQNEFAVQYLAASLPELILEINDDQRSAVQKILLDGINEGKDGYEIAREIRDSVGLTDAQMSWVQNFRDQLESGETGAYTPVDDRRLSATDAQLAQDEMNSDNTNQDMVDYLVDKYTASLTNKRAMDISATEIHNASIQGQDDIWQTAKSLGYLDPATTRRHWLATGDDRTRETHMQAQDMNEPDGVGLDEPFQTPFGDTMNPGDSGDDSEDINCRCVTFLTFEDSGEENTPSPDESDMEE